MNRKAKSRNKGGRNEVNVRPINDRIEPYDEALATYRSHPSAPTFLLLINRALDAGIRLKSLESELNNIVSVPDDQFFGAHGSQYFARNHNALLEARSLRPLEPHVDALCEVIWQVLRRVQSSEVWVYGDFLTGIGDFVHLSESDSEVDVGATEVNGPSTVLGEGDAASAVKAAISMFMQGVEESERARRTISDLAQQHGHSLLPWAAWILDQLESRPDLQEGLEDFEEYLKLYFNYSSEMETADSHVKPMKLDPENSSALLGFAAFLMFFALYRRTLYEGGSFEISTFFPERLRYLSDPEVLDSPTARADYLIAISNLLMMAAKLDVESAKAGLVTEHELRRSFLRNNQSDDLILANLIMLPPSGIVQILSEINPYEGDANGQLEIAPALRAASYGVPGKWSAENFIELFEGALGGLDADISKELRQRLRRSVKKWVIPISMTEKLASLFDEFWSDQIIIARISSALCDIDWEEKDERLFSIEMLSETARQAEYFTPDTHPAIVARKFSNAIDFMEFDGNDWMALVDALHNAGQRRHACTVLALLFTVWGVSRSYNLKQLIKVEMPELISRLSQLRNEESFRLVRQSISDLFDLSGEVSALWRGSLRDYGLAPAAKVVSLRVGAEFRLRLHEEKLRENGFNLQVLAEDARNSLLKGYSLARDFENTGLSLKDDAVRNYVWAIEHELRTRISSLDTDAAQELSYLGVNLDWRRSRVRPERLPNLTGLGSLCILIKRFKDLSGSTKAKLSDLSALALHAEVDLFLSSMRTITGIRNSTQHGEYGTDQISATLPHVEALVFGDGSILRILCETR